MRDREKENKRDRETERQEERATNRQLFPNIWPVFKMTMFTYLNMLLCLVKIKIEHL